MARLQFVKNARKEDKNYGIKVGDSYYWWQFRFGGKCKSKTKPKRSQLTQSSYYSQIWDLQDSIIEDVDKGKIESSDSFEEFIENLISEIENIQSECQESFDNIPEQLQEGNSGSILQERIDACDSTISELESIDIEKVKGESIEEYKEKIIDEIDSALFNLNI